MIDPPSPARRGNHHVNRDGHVGQTWPPLLTPARTQWTPQSAISPPLPQRCSSSMSLNQPLSKSSRRTAVSLILIAVLRRDFSSGHFFQLRHSSDTCSVGIASPIPRPPPLLRSRRARKQDAKTFIRLVVQEQTVTKVLISGIDTRRTEFGIWFC